MKRGHRCIGEVPIHVSNCLIATIGHRELPHPKQKAVGAAEKAIIYFGQLKYLIEHTEYAKYVIC